MYQKPIDDPWFSAHDEEPNLVNNIPFWTADAYVRVLGCIDQYQFCSATKPNLCTALGGARRLADAKSFEGLPFTFWERMTMMRLAGLLSFFSTQESVDGRGAAALRAQEVVYENIGLPLPRNQWQIEVSSWMAVSLAKLQRMAVEFATGPNFMAEGSSMELPEALEPMCYSQKVRHSGDHVSFSICGMVIILVIGGILILLNMVIDTVGGWYQQRRRTGLHRRRQWMLDEKLQLQRLAYEGLGQGTWSGATDLVPLTEAGQLLGMPEDVNEKQPRRVERALGGQGSSRTRSAEGSPFLPQNAQADRHSPSDSKLKSSTAQVTEISTP